VTEESRKKINFDRFSWEAGETNPKAESPTLYLDYELSFNLIPQQQ